MNVGYGYGKTEFGPGVIIDLTGDEVATAIDAYLVSHGVYVSGARTVRVNRDLGENGTVYVDPTGFVISDGERLSGRGPNDCVNRPEKAMEKTMDKSKNAAALTGTVQPLVGQFEDGCLELEREITLGGILGWQDRKWHVFRDSGDSVTAGSGSLFELICSLLPYV